MAECSSVLPAATASAIFLMIFSVSLAFIWIPFYRVKWGLSAVEDVDNFTAQNGVASGGGAAGRYGLRPGWRDLRG